MARSLSQSTRHDNDHDHIHADDHDDHMHADGLGSHDLDACSKKVTV